MNDEAMSYKRLWISARDDLVSTVVSPAFRQNLVKLQRDIPAARKRLNE